MTAIETLKKFRYEIILDGHMERRCNFSGVLGDKFQLTFKFKDVEGNALQVDGVEATLRFSQKGSIIERLELATGGDLTASGSSIVALVDTAELDLPLVYSFQLRLTKDSNTFVATQGDADLTGLIE